MHDSKRNVVWILGSGFSRPLGGPTMDELFEDHTLARVCGAVSGRNEELERHARIVYALYHARPSPWRDPEDFLDVLDTAGSEQKPATGLQSAVRVALEAARETSAVDRNNPRDRGVQPLSPDFDSIALPTDDKALCAELARMARIYLAVACHQFLPDKPESVGPRGRPLERWRPYVDWAGLLGSSEFRHTVATFNYDMVVEWATGFQAAEPSSVRKKRKNGASLPSPVLLKLHGSVAWKHARGDAVTAYGSDPWELIANGRAPLIAGPGIGKQNTIGTCLEPLWEAAVDAISDANVVVFIGYRFPETDASARTRLLTALSDHGRDELTIRTVLGANTTHEHAVRLRSLILSALSSDVPIEYQEPATFALMRSKEKRGPVLVTAPLFAQDFLGLVENEWLDLWRYAERARVA